MYLQLCDTVTEKGVKDVWARIEECSAPRPCRGTDYVQNMYITDPSLAGEGLTAEQERLKEGLEVLIFSNEMNLFPRVAKPGDFIRFHRVIVRDFSGHPQLNAKIGRGHQCQYCLFDCDPEGAVEPYQRSSVNYSWTPLDQELLQDLRAISVQMANGNGKEKYVVQICSMLPMTFVDLVCKVLAVEDPDTRHQVLYVWDGSDATAYPNSIDFLESRLEGRPQSNVENPVDEDDLKLCRRLPFLESSDLAAVDSSCPLLGTVLPVNLYKPLVKAAASPISKKLTGAKPLPELPKAGQWVKLKNVQTVVIEGQLQALYLPSSKWVPWQEDKQCLAAYQHRLQSNQVSARMPAAENLRAQWISESKQETPFTSLRQILLEAGSRERQTYRCLVHLVNYLPADAAEFCRQRQNDSFEFCVKLHLQDATADLDALLLGEHGQAFFRECPQQDLSKSPQDAETIQAVMNALCSKPESVFSEAGQWFECGIERLYPDPGESQENVHARYRIVDTILQSLEGMVKDRAMHQALLGSPL